MLKLTYGVIATVLLAAITTNAQQSPNPQPALMHVQSAPCVTMAVAPNPSGNNTAIKVPGKWRQLLDKQRQQIEARTGIPMPDVATGTAQPANAQPTPLPCSGKFTKNCTARCHLAFTERRDHDLVM